MASEASPTSTTGSWPVLTSNIHPEDFLFTLNTGDQIFPHAAGMVPNWELNERNTVVVFGDLGNRLSADDPDAVIPVKLEVVDDGSPVEFLGPDGVRSGVGLTWETDATPYDWGPSSWERSSTTSATNQRAKAASRRSTSRWDPTTSSPSTAAATSGCAS